MQVVMLLTVKVSERFLDVMLGLGSFQLQLRGLGISFKQLRPSSYLCFGFCGFLFVCLDLGVICLLGVF